MNFVKGKVIVAFLSGCIALFFAWEASRQASIEILKNVDRLSKPVERLHMVNRLFRDINRLEQLQRAQAIQGKTQDTSRLVSESIALRRSLDTLGEMYAGDNSQLARISSMKQILQERDSLFGNYIKVREGLVNSRELSEQLEKLTKIYSRSPTLVEKIITTERTATVSVSFPTENPSAAKESSRGFLGRLFGKKKAEKKVAPVDEPIQLKEKQPHEELVSETLAVKIDTLTTKGNADSLKHELDKVRRTIVSTQKHRSTSFVNREAALMSAGNILINQMLNVLQEVEKDAVKQVDKNNLLTKIVVKDGANRIVSIILLFVIATAILLYLILTDISKSARYRKELELAKDEAIHHSAVRQRFLANMSHEIRTPLQSIIGYSEQLRHQDNPRKEDIEAIYYSSEHLLQIVNEILDYSRLASGKFSLNYSSFSMNKLLLEIIAVMHPQAAKKSIELILHNESDFDFVKGDAFRLKQILYNLLSNAIKFTDEGGVVLDVSSTDDDKAYHFIFSVEDTGGGIPKDSLSNIFNQFEQVSTSAVAATSGTGLGLSIVKELVELQGGTVKVESELGKGSRFTVELSFAKPSGVVVPESQPEDIIVDENVNVYVVDDDNLILHLCSSILQKHGIAHICYNSPKQLLEEITNLDEAIVLADIRMPEMSGLELCAALRKLSSKLKVFALTAQALPEERQVILESGFDGILMKPFREADLLGLLKVDPEQVKPPEEEVGSNINLSSIEQMTFGDTGRLIKILKQYVDDSLQDINQLVSFHGHEPEVSFLLHRLAGRSSQLGASKLAALMCELELIAMDTLPGEKVSREDLLMISREVESVIKTVNDEINRLYDTSPSYNKEFSGQY